MSIETARIHALMERLNAKNPARLTCSYDTPVATPSAGASSAPPVPPRASEASIDRSAPSSSQLDSIQVLLNRLQYNFLPQTFFTLEKNRAFYRIAGTAKEILQESLPIRCLEATFLALHLSCPLRDVERFPISFKSRASKTGQTHRHIVLGVKHKGLYGALGLSRSSLLMNKPFLYKSIVELLEVYCQCYQQVGHQLVSFKLGLFVTHDPYSKIIPCWRFLSLTPTQPFHRIQDCIKTSTTVEHFELLLPVMSDQYLKLHSGIGGAQMFDTIAPPTPASHGPSVASASSTVKPSSAPPTGPPGQPPLLPPPVMIPDNDDDVSDSDENQHRIGCVLAMSSPFSPLLHPAATTNDQGRSRFSSRLRRAVHENPFETSGAMSSTATTANTPTSRRSRTVPPSRRTKGADASTTGAPPAQTIERDAINEDDVGPLQRQPSMGTERANAFLDLIDLPPLPAPPRSSSEPSLITASSAATLRPPTEPPEPRSAQSFKHVRLTHSSETDVNTTGLVTTTTPSSSVSGKVVATAKKGGGSEARGGGLPPKKPTPKSSTSSTSTSSFRVDI